MSVETTEPTLDLSQIHEYYRKAWQFLGVKKNFYEFKRDGDHLKDRVNTAEKDLAKLVGKTSPETIQEFQTRFAEIGQRMDEVSRLMESDTTDKTPEEVQLQTERAQFQLKRESERVDLLNHQMETELAKPNKKRKAQSDLSKYELKLTNTRKGEWQKCQVACENAIKSLREISESALGDLDDQRKDVESSVSRSTLLNETSFNYDQLVEFDGYLEELEFVKRLVDSALRKATSDQSGFAKLVNNVGKEIKKCEPVLTLPDYQDFNIRFETVSVQPSDFVLASKRLTDLLGEVSTKFDEQTRLQTEYNRLEPEVYSDSKPCLLKTLEALGATFDYREYYSVYSRAHHHAATHEFDEGITLLNRVKTEVTPRIEEIELKKNDWEELANELLGNGETGSRRCDNGKIFMLIQTYTREEETKDKKPWTNKYKPELMQAMKDIDFKAGKLGCYAICIEELTDLWIRKLGQVGEAVEDTEDSEWGDEENSRPIGEIQQHIQHMEDTFAEDEEKYKAFLKLCDDALFLYDQLKTKNEELSADWLGIDGQPLVRESWDIKAITDEIGLARGLAVSGNQMKRGLELDSGIEEGKLILAKQTKEMKRLLSGSANKDLLVLNVSEEVKIQYDKAKTAWETARKEAEKKLDELAQLGGDAYFDCLDLFEGFDQQIETCEKTINSFLGLFPDISKVAKALNSKDDALKSYQRITENASADFLTKIQEAITSQTEGLAAAKEAFKEAAAAAQTAWEVTKSRAGTWFDDSRTKSYFDSLKAELETALAYGKLKGKEPQTTSVGALNAGENLLKKLKVQMDKVPEGGFSEVKELVKTTKAEISKEGIIKKYTRNTYDALIDKFEKVIVPDLQGLSPNEEKKALQKFKTEEIDPAFAGASTIKRIREALPAKQTEIDARIKELIEWVNSKTPYEFPLDPPDLGSITSDYQRCVDLILRDQSPGLVKAADDRLDKILDPRLRPNSDQLSSSWPAACQSSIETRDEEIRETAENVDRVRQALKEFMENETMSNRDEVSYKFAKRFVKENNGDKNLISTIEKSRKPIEQMLDQNEFVNAENELAQMKQHAKDAVNSDQKKAKALKPLGDAFVKKVAEVNKGFASVKNSIKNSIDGDTLSSDQANKVITKIPDLLGSRGVKPDLFAEPMVILDNQQAKRAERRAARERVLQLVRDYKEILMKDPILVKLRGNPFVPVGTGPLYVQLRKIEDAVVVTV